MLPSRSSLCKISFGGSAMCGILQTRSFFCSVFFLSPPSCGGAVGGVPSVGDLHPTDKSKRQLHASLDTLVVIIIVAYNTILCCAFSLSLWYFGCLCLAHSDHPPKQLKLVLITLIKGIAVKVFFFFFFLPFTTQCQDRTLFRALSQCGGRSPGGNNSP